MPQVKRLRYKNDFGIKDEDIEVYINDLELAKWFEEVAEELKNKEKIKTASNYTTSDYIGLKKSNLVNLAVKPPSVKNFIELINLVEDNKVSSRVAKDI